MDITFNKIIKVTLALSGLKNEELADKIGINKATLSRNESKSIYLKVRQFFDKYDPEINEAIDVILNYFEINLDDPDKLNVVKEPFLRLKKQDNSSEIRRLKNDLKDYMEIERILSDQLRRANMRIDELDKELTEANSRK